ncbi:c-type cytochrome [Tsuneonella sp. HG249]
MAELVEIRHDNFEAISKANKAIKKELERDAPDLKAVGASAADIAARGPPIRGYFPVGSGPEAGLKTEALPTIWEKPAEFSAAADKLVASAKALQSAANGGDADETRSAAATMGGTCKACHDNFRQKKS